MAVLPDDVRWLTGLLDLDGVAVKPLLEAVKSLLGGVAHNFVKLLGSLVSFLALEGHEDGAWPSAFVEVGVLVVIDFSVDFAHIVEVVGLDGGSSLPEQVDQIRILEGERGSCNLDSLGWLFFVAEVWKLGQLGLHLVLDPLPEMGGHWDVLVLVDADLGHKGVVEFVSDIELD